MVNIVYFSVIVLSVKVMNVAQQRVRRRKGQQRKKKKEEKFSLVWIIIQDEPVMKSTTERPLLSHRLIVSVLPSLPPTVNI